jgi:hypothetical protein
MSRVLRRIFSALGVLSLACGPNPSGRSYIMLHLWGAEMGDTSVAALVRVELTGSGWPPWERAPTGLSGATGYGVYGRSGPVVIPAQGTLLVRVALVAPNGDTLARSAWDTIHLARSYKYDITVAVADSSGPHGECGPVFKRYSVPTNRFVDSDSLLVDVGGMEIGAVC